jgi:hypothetical protein
VSRRPRHRPRLHLLPRRRPHHLDLRLCRPAAPFGRKLGVGHQTFSDVFIGLSKNPPGRCQRRRARFRRHHSAVFRRRLFERQGDVFGGLRSTRTNSRMLRVAHLHRGRSPRRQRIAALRQDGDRQRGRQPRPGLDVIKLLFRRCCVVFALGNVVKILFGWIIQILHFRLRVTYKQRY